jgi:hypothetical protein
LALQRNTPAAERNDSNFVTFGGLNTCTAAIFKSAFVSLQKQLLDKNLSKWPKRMAKFAQSSPPDLLK